MLLYCLLFKIQKAANNFVTVITKTRKNGSKFVNICILKLVLKTCLVIQSSRGAFAKHVFLCHFLRLNFYMSKRSIWFFSLISFVQNSEKYFRKLFNKRFKISRWIILTLFRLNHFILNRPKKFSVILGINTLILPDIDYFVVFTPWLLHRKR